jgi:hypothetical protein
MTPDSQPVLPRWIFLSNLPLHLLEKGKSPAPWLMLRTIIECDMESHPLAPGLVEMPLVEFSVRSGLDAPRLEKALKVLRKEGLVRAFLPEHEEETALFQVLTPLPTPVPLDEVAKRHPELLMEADWPPRYAVANQDVAASSGDLAASRLARVQRVVELYLDVFSMKVNNLILEELQLISSRYEMPLIEKIFQRAQKEQKRSLGWIVSEIRKETKLRAKAEELRQQERQSAL